VQEAFREAWKRNPQMTSSPHAQPAPGTIRITVPAWAWALALLGVVLLYLIAQDSGAVLAAAGNTMHEFFHDARHALGVPCH
jgi:hypothetical protein